MAEPLVGSASASGDVRMPLLEDRRPPARTRRAHRATGSHRRGDEAGPPRERRAKSGPRRVLPQDPFTGSGGRPRTGRHHRPAPCSTGGPAPVMPRRSPDHPLLARGHRVEPCDGWGRTPAASAMRATTAPPAEATRGGGWMLRRAAYAALACRRTSGQRPGRSGSQVLDPTEQGARPARPAAHSGRSAGGPQRAHRVHGPRGGDSPDGHGGERDGGLVHRYTVTARALTTARARPSRGRAARPDPTPSRRSRSRTTPVPQSECASGIPAMSQPDSGPGG